MTGRPAPTASELAQARVAAMLQELACLRQTLRQATYPQLYTTTGDVTDDLADRGLTRNLIADVRAGLDDVERRLMLPPPERKSDRRLRHLRAAEGRGAMHIDDLRRLRGG